MPSMTIESMVDPNILRVGEGHNLTTANYEQAQGLFVTASLAQKEIIQRMGFYKNLDYKST